MKLIISIFVVLMASYAHAQVIYSPELNLLTTFEDNRFIERGKTIATIRGNSVVDCSGVTIAVIRGDQLMTPSGVLMARVRNMNITTPSGVLMARVTERGILDPKGRLMFRSEGLDPMIATVYLIGLNYAC